MTIPLGHPDNIPPRAPGSPGHQHQQELNLMDSGHLGENRNPLNVWLLSLVACGIYYLVYYYRINDEIRQHDPNIKVNPGIAVLALCLPIANFITVCNTAARIRQ